MQAERNLVVATDGSKKAVNSFRYSCDLFKRSANFFTKIVVVSVIDPNKDYLPTDLQPKYLEESIKNSLLSRFPQSKYEIVMRRKEVDAKTDVLKIAKERRAILLAMGFQGRKAESNTKEGGHTLLGSSVEHSLSFSTIPILVCKNQYVQKDSYTFGACIDGSKRSFQALDYILKLRAQNDKVIVMYAPHFTNQKNMREQIKQKVSKIGGITYVELPLSKTPTETLITYINEDPTHHFDFVMIGGNGERAEAEGKQFIGRTARKVLLEALSNIILLPEYFA